MHTGFRPDTLYRMQVEHIDFPERLLAIPQHKTSGDDESTELPISTTVAAMLKSIIGNRTTGNVLLRKPSLVKFTKELETLFGKRIVAKDMRSTHATLALSLEISDYIVKVLELRSITFTIRQYTQVVLGSNAVYEQTWGRSCGALSLINNVFRGGAGGQGANQAYDLTPANAAVGFPSLVSAMPNTDMVIDWYECGDTGGCYNIFTDIYLHEVNDRSLLPTNATNGGSPQTQYQGTINGISQNDTKLWNFNFWHNTNP